MIRVSLLDSLQQLVNALPGWVLDFPQGRWFLDEPLVLDQPITLHGSGHETVIYAPPGEDGIVIRSSHVRLADLRIVSRGGDPSQKSRHGVVVEGQPTPRLLTDVRLERVSCWEHGGDGFRLGHGVPGTSEVVEITMLDCKATHNAGHGIHAGAVYESLRITGLSANLNGLSGATFDRCGTLKLERSYLENNWNPEFSTLVGNAELVLDRCNGATLDSLNLESYRAAGILVRNCVSGRIVGGSVAPHNYGARPGIRLEACRGWEIGPMAITNATPAVEFDSACSDCEARKIVSAWGYAPVVKGASWGRNVKVTK